MLVTVLHGKSHSYLLKSIDKVKRLNMLEPDDEVRQLWLRKFRALLSSINNLNDADSHPIGLELSIFLYSNSAQKILNVKHLKTSSTLLEQDREIPCIKPTILYSKNTSKPEAVNWIRCRIEADSQETIINELPINLHLKSIYRLSSEIFEFYFHDSNVLECMLYFESSPYVKSIIFYSNCRLFKTISTNPLQTISNTMKFYYCNQCSKIDFTVESIEDMRSLNFYYLLSVLFMYKDNLATNQSDVMTTPLAILSGTNPSRSVSKKAHVFDDLDDYHRNLHPREKKLDSRDTAISELSQAKNSQHRVYELSNDRDTRMLGLGSMLGSRNMHEITISQFSNDSF